MIRSTPPLSGMRFALVGAGAAGGAVTGWLEAAGARCVQVGASLPSPRASALASGLGASLVDIREMESRDTDLLLIAVTDDALHEVASILAQRPQAPIALHLAGALGADAIAPLRSAGCAVGGFHPLHAFAGTDLRSLAPRDIFFALGGDPKAAALGGRLADALQGVSAVIADGARPIYHLAATLLAGGLTTLVAAAFEIRRRAGIPPQADDGYARLAAGALAGAFAAADPAASITGPAARGDLATFTDEIRALAGSAPEAVPVVLALARETLRQRARTSPPTAARKALAQALEVPDFLDLAGDRVLTSSREPHG